MKKILPILTWSLFILTMLYPVGVLVTASFGYVFELVSISAFAIVIAGISVSIVILDHKRTINNKALQILVTILAPLTLINAVFYIFEYPKMWVIASVLLSAGCCFYLAIKCGKPLALKIIALILSALMIVPIGFMSFLFLIFGNIGQNTVVKTVESPSGKYYAQVIDSDQGALGGDTLVDVHEKSGINAILFRIEKKPQRVYSGEWGEFNNIQIHWKDDECLIINSIEYIIQ